MDLYFKPLMMQKIMRHANIQTTMRYYSGVNLERSQDEIAETFAAIQARIQSSVISSASPKKPKRKEQPKSKSSK